VIAGWSPSSARLYERLLQKEGRVQGFVTQLYRKDGGRIWVSVSARTVRDESGALLYYEGTPEDITERNRAEELSESHRRTERMSAMGLLVGGVAHEVRNPLFGISANLDALEATGARGSEFEAVIARMRSEVDRLASLMKELLDYGKPLETALAPDSSAGGLVSVSVEERAAGLVVTISDTGPGFPPEDLHQVFEPFFSRRRGAAVSVRLPVATPAVSRPQRPKSAVS
jgi:signal transduction histidine kinase